MNSFALYNNTVYISHCGSSQSKALHSFAQYVTSCQCGVVQHVAKYSIVVFGSVYEAKCSSVVYGTVYDIAVLGIVQ